MRPEAVPSEWAEKAAGEIAGAWDGEYIDIPTAREMARHALAAVLSEVQAQALRDAADEWQTREWANVPRRADRVADRLGAAQYVCDWLRKRAAGSEAAPTEEAPDAG